MLDDIDLAPLKAPSMDIILSSMLGNHKDGPGRERLEHVLHNQGMPKRTLLAFNQVFICVCVHVLVVLSEHEGSLEQLPKGARRRERSLSIK